ncbi:MAG TPA: FkbM family methyltransferase [Planctomycetaceae bacterium]|nr:FkbM family methyltransferase [Planctomycetaceae bacterium]
MSWRQTRNSFLNLIGFERSYLPRYLFKNPDLMGVDLLGWCIARLLLEVERPQFLQIGAFDGQHDDALYDSVCRYKLKGWVVEPQPAAFEALQKTYRDQPQVTPINAAISNKNETRTFYTTVGAPSTVASFERSHLLKHSIKSDQITSSEVECVTLDHLIEEYEMEPLHLMQIDTEGFDFEIVKSLMASSVRPTVVRYEQLHLTNTEKEQALQMLAEEGYRFLCTRQDVLATKV